MTNVTRKPKQTAGNNAALARIRKAMNTPTFRECSRLMNEEGELAVRTYLRQFFNEQAQHVADGLIDGPPAPHYCEACGFGLTPAQTTETCPRCHGSK